MQTNSAASCWALKAIVTARPNFHLDLLLLAHNSAHILSPHMTPSKEQDQWGVTVIGDGAIGKVCDVLL